MLETKSFTYHFAECKPKPSLGSSKDPSHPMKLKQECTVIHHLASSKDLHSRASSGADEFLGWKRSAWENHRSVIQFEFVQLPVSALKV